MTLMGREVPDGVEVRSFDGAPTAEDGAGWVPVVENRPTLAQGQMFAGPVYEMAEDGSEVIAAYSAVRAPAPATAPLEASLAGALAQLRERLAGAPPAEVGPALVAWCDSLLDPEG